MRDGIVGIGLNRSDLLFTRLVSVRDRTAEEAGGPPVMRTVRISEFCRLCARRRGKVVTQHYVDGDQGYIACVWHNPCGHMDTFVSVLAEAELSCASRDCVLLVSDADYPYCSPSCAPHENLL